MPVKPLPLLIATAQQAKLLTILVEVLAEAAQEAVVPEATVPAGILSIFVLMALHGIVLQADM